MRRLFSTLISATAVLLFAVFAWLGAQGASWAWAAVALSILYTAGALLYRWESRLPPWMAQVIQVAATFWPPIKWLRTSDEVYAANKGLVDDFNLTLAEYQLEPLDKERGEELAERARLLKVRTLAEAWTGQRAPSGDGTARPGVDALELFYRERSGKVTVNLWQAQKDDLVRELAPLVRRNWQVSASGRYPFSDADVHRLLDSLRDFDIDLIAKELRAASQLGGRLRRYAEFLRTGREESARAVGGIASPVEEREGESSANASALFRIESPAEILKLMEALEERDDPALGAVHRGIFLAERDFDAGALKELACAVVSQWPANGDTDPIRVLQAYLWEKDQRGWEAVTPDELDSNWRKWSDNARKALESTAAGSFDADRNRLAYRLEAGTWPTRRGAHSDDPYPPPPPPPPIAASGHEEIRDLDAYLITFDERSGSIAKVVDGLRRAPGQRSIYRFGPYTRHTRLGIVPRGMAFHEFVERFFADLDDALRSYRSEPNGRPISDGPALRFAAGRPRTIVLKHDHKCRGPVEFAIAEQPTTGRLGEIESWPERGSRQALVRYFPESVTTAKGTSFAYTSSCADRQESRTVPLLVEPKGHKGRLEQIEVTVNRIDLAHCRELWFGDPALGPVMRSPSIYDVLAMIEPELDRDERPSVEAAFERVAGRRHPQSHARRAGR